jgi:two-component system, sensor histidine kinase PdtaS
LAVKYLHCGKSVPWLIIVALLLFSKTISSQVIQGPESILNTFKQELNSVKNQNSDTLPLYSKYIKKLVNRGNFIEADSIFNANSLGFLAIQDSSKLINIYESRAYMYKVQRRFSKSLNDYLWLKSYYERSDDTQNLIKILNLLAEYYRAIGLYDLCDKHLNQSKNLFSNTVPSKSNLAYWYSRKAAWSNEYLKNQDSVVYYAKNGLDLAVASNDFETSALLLNELGYSEMARNASEKVILDYFNRAKDLLFKNERYRDYIEIMNNLAGYHFNVSKDLDKTLELLEAIIPVEDENDWYAPLQRSLEYACGVYQSKNMLKQYDDYLHRLFEVRLANQDSFYKILVDDQALTYEKSIASKELEVQEQKTKVAQKEAVSNKRAFIISMVIAVVLLLIALISFQINLRFRRKNELLSEQRNQIQSVNDELGKSLEQQRLLFKELNHRVKNNLSILTGLIYLQEVAEGNNEFKKTLGKLRNRIKSMALAHESLYNAEQVEKIDFQNYLNALFQELKNALSDGNKIKVQIDCKGFELDLKQAVPVAMIINELFTNSIKHGYTELHEGIISVKAYHGEAFSTIEYTDDGVGFGIKDAKNRTLGLRLVNLLLEQLDAKLIDKSEEKGVSFVIEIPNP